MSQKSGLSISSYSEKDYLYTRIQATYLKGHALLHNMMSPASFHSAAESKSEVCASLPAPNKKQAGSIILDLPMLSQLPCQLCDKADFELVFVVESSHKEHFQVVRCVHCKLVQVNPQPNARALRAYYQENYFLQRTKRGYDNYYSETTAQEICRVSMKNLRDLDFPAYEEEIMRKAKRQRNNKMPRALDIGCASGYFVELLLKRGWAAEGIELSQAPAQVGQARNLQIHIGDFLTYDKLCPCSYDLISFWASIEHMRQPKAALQRSASLLRKGGRLLLSTCRYGMLARIQKEKWRFMNVPEHLYFFNLLQLQEMASLAALESLCWISYGSGLTKKKRMGVFYKSSKAILDFLAKATGQGDMMALHFIKK